MTPCPVTVEYTEGSFLTMEGGKLAFQERCDRVLGGVVQLQ